MGLNAFLVTAASCLVAGILIGIFMRDIVELLSALYKRVYHRPRLLEPYRVEGESY